MSSCRLSWNAFRRNNRAYQVVALNTCPAASSIRYEYSTFNQQSKPRSRAGVRGLRRYTMNYKLTFFYVPAVIIAIFLSLFLIPISLGNPWTQIKVWDFLLILSWSYVIVGLLRFPRKPRDEAIHLLVIGFCVILLSSIFCLMSFSSFHYIFSPTNWLITGGATAVVVAFLTSTAFNVPNSKP